MVRVPFSVSSQLMNGKLASSQAGNQEASQAQSQAHKLVILTICRLLSLSFRSQSPLTLEEFDGQSGNTN